MKVVIAIDSFKGSLSSLQAGKAAASGIRRAFPDANIQVCPLADGGEGTVDALTEGLGGRLRQIRVTGPLGDPVECQYGIIQESQTAILEMSKAAGLPLVPYEKRDPLITTTYGVGEMIADAIGQGCRRFLVGIGGSATNDGGLGMLQALGFKMLDAEGNDVPPGAQGLEKLAVIDVSGKMPQLEECTFRIACDVQNPLCGSAGSSVVFGPQKGADAATVAQMDRWMERYSRLVMSVSDQADPSYPGCGAAGGLGFAFLSFTNASLESGVKIVLEETNLEQHLKEADIVVTGEGRLDGQTIMGKGPIGTAQMAKKHGLPVIAFAGCLGEDASICNDYGIDAFFPILRTSSSEENAMEELVAFRNLENTAEQAFRLIRAVRGL